MNMQTPTIKVCEGCGVMRFGETGSKVLDSMTADLRSRLDSTTLENVRLVDENRVLRAELAEAKVWNCHHQAIHVVIDEREAAIRERDEARAHIEELRGRCLDWQTERNVAMSERDSLRSRVEVLEGALDRVVATITANLGDYLTPAAEQAAKDFETGVWNAALEAAAQLTWHEGRRLETMPDRVELIRSLRRVTRGHPHPKHIPERKP
jgi:hypothetical protein